MKLQQFNGGLHTLPEPQFIALTEGTVYENIDSDSKTLKSVKKPKITDITSKKYSYWFDAGNRWVDSDSRVDYVEYEENLYFTDRTTTPQKMNKGGVVSNLGMRTPQTPSTVAVKSPEPISEVKIVAATAEAGLSLKDQYYLLINDDAEMQSNALQFLVNTQGRVSTIAQSTNNPVIYPQIDTTSDETTKRTVAISEITGVTAGSLGYKLYRQYKGVWRFVGIVPEDGSLVDNVDDISGNVQLDSTKFGALNGTYQYVITYYDSRTGNEGPPSNPTVERVLTNGGYIRLSNIPVTADNQVDKVRIYRVGGNLGQFSLVATIDKGVTTYTDTVLDVNVPGTLLSTTNAGLAPTGLAFLQQAYAMLFGAVGSRLRFTPIGYPDRWPATYYLQFAADITGIAPVANGILVFTKFKTYIVTGTGPTSLSQYLLSSDQGCIAFESVQLIGTEAVWASLDGICTSSGNRPVVVTKEKLGKIVLNPIDSVVYDETYYLVEADTTILILEKGIIKRLNVGVETLVVSKDILYGYMNGLLYEMFKSDEDATFKWTSARLTEGAITVNKTYKDIFTYVEGRVTINILINDKLVQSQQLEGTDSFTVKIPQNQQRGFFIQFEIVGEGKLAELEYQVGAKANGG